MKQKQISILICKMFLEINKKKKGKEWVKDMEVLHRRRKRGGQLTHVKRSTSQVIKTGVKHGGVLYS